METIFEFGKRMALEVCNGANHSSAYICEYENFVGTADETEFCSGWNSVISLTGEVQMHQMLHRMEKTGMTLMDFLEKWGFTPYNSVKGCDGYNIEYRSKSYIIDLYDTGDSVTCYLLNKNKNHVLDVEPIVDGLFDEWDNYLSTR